MILCMALILIEQYNCVLWICLGQYLAKEQF